MGRKIVVGLVGAGYWGKKLLPKFIKSELSSVKIVCDKIPASRADINKNFPEVATTESFQELLEDSEVQALVIVTPPATHFSLAREAIAAGKHVWIEKPLALRLNEGRELARLVCRDARPGRAPAPAGGVDRSARSGWL